LEGLADIIFVGEADETWPHPLSGTKRTSQMNSAMSASDPKRTCEESASLKTDSWYPRGLVAGAGRASEAGRGEPVEDPVRR
jgi:hypothetical protein